MIHFNGIELDYNEKTLNKIVVKKSLTDIETMANRKGTSSTTFDVPRTAKNEKAFGLMTLDGSLFNPIGSAEIRLEGNLYAKGSIKVQGYNDTVFKLLFKGSDIDVIDIFKITPLKSVIKTSYSNLYAGSYWMYDDVFIKNAMSNIVPGALDYVYSTPQSLPLYSASNLAPFFKTNSIINKMFNDLGYTVVSDFMATNYADTLYFSNFEDKHFSTSLTSNITNTLTTGTSSAVMSLGNIILGNGVTKTGNKYYFVDDVEELKLGLKITIAENDAIESVKFSLEVYETVGGVTTQIVQAPAADLVSGENVILLKTETQISAGSYFEAKGTVILKTGLSSPSTFDLEIEDVKIQNSNVKDGAVVLLNDYLGDLSQLEFLQNYLKFHNLVMNIENETVYIDCQDDVFAYGVNLPGIAITEKDITDKISSFTDVSLDYSLAEFIYFEQKMITGEAQTVESLSEVSTVGSVFKRLNSYGEGTEIYTVDFQSVYDALDGYTLQAAAAPVQQGANTLQIPKLFTDFIKIDAPSKKIPIGFASEWENFITHNTGLSINVNYEEMDGTILPTVNKFYFINQITRYKSFGYAGFYGAIDMFKQTLEQKKNNKVREIELYDYSGTLINFRTNYIINKQIYKLLSYEFEPISKRIKAKIILK